MKDALKDIPKCLYEACMKYPRTRGLCALHYGTAQNYVKNGHTTWQELIDLGIALPINPGARRKGKYGSFGSFIREKITNKRHAELDTSKEESSDATRGVHHRPVTKKD